MLATIHSAVKATMTLTSWPNTRLQLPSLALYMRIRLTSMSAPSAPINTGSRWATKRLLRRLIIFNLRGIVYGLQRLGRLAEQVIIEHLARDRCGRRAAVAAVFNQHRQGDARLVGRRESNKPGMVAVAFGDL